MDYKLEYEKIKKEYDKLVEVFSDEIDANLYVTLRYKLKQMTEALGDVQYDINSDKDDKLQERVDRFYTNIPKVYQAIELTKSKATVESRKKAQLGFSPESYANKG